MTFFSGTIETLEINTDQFCVNGLLNGLVNDIPANRIIPYQLQIGNTVYQSQVGQLSYRNVRINRRAYMIYAMVGDDGELVYTRTGSIDDELPAFFLINSYREYFCEYIYIPIN